MGKKKKEVMELRFYEISQNEYALTVSGDSPGGGQEGPGLHFHNLMEIGVCRGGTGELILDEERIPYQPAMISIIPCNFPHAVIGNAQDGTGSWEYLYLDPAQFAAGMHAGDGMSDGGISDRINRRAMFVHEWEYRNLSLLVKMIVEEMRTKRPHYNESVYGLLQALVAEILRAQEQETERMKPETAIPKNTGATQISAALDHVRMYYERMLRIEELAQVCKMSETHFRRVFESCMNMSPVDYINLVRIQKACDLMRKSDDSMDVIARKVGFATASTFNRNFKKFLNTSPYRWKRNPKNCDGKQQDCRILAGRGR